MYVHVQTRYDVICMEDVLEDSGTVEQAMCTALRAITASADLTGQSALVLAVRAFDHGRRTHAQVTLLMGDDASGIALQQPHHMDIMHAAVLTSAINANGGCRCAINASGVCRTTR